MPITSRIPIDKNVSFVWIWATANQETLGAHLVSFSLLYINKLLNVLDNFLCNGNTFFILSLYPGSISEEKKKPK